jgi:hypothetical protein
MFDDPFEFRLPQPWPLERFEPMIDMAEDDNGYVV